MALGKNLKKQQKQLIPDKKEAKKRVPAAKKAPTRTQKKTPEKKDDSAAHVLFNYISAKEQQRRKDLRAQYQKEILAMSDQAQQFVVFKIGAEEYAIEIFNVTEVVLLSTELSAAPNSPDHVLGLTSLRGQTYLVVDLSLKFGKPTNLETKYLIAVNTTKSSIAFVLNNLPRILKVSGDQVTGDLSELDSAANDVTYIKGLIEVDDRLIFYLDVEELIKNDQAMVVPEELINQK